MSNELFHNKVRLLGFVLYYQKSRKYFVFVVVFIPYVKCMLYQILLQFCILSIVCLIREEKKLNQSFEFNSELHQSSYYLVDFFFLNQLTSCLFLNAWVISNLAGSERKLFLSYGSWEAGMEWASDLSPTYYGDTEVLYGHIDWLCCLSEGSFWMAVLPFVPKGYSIPVACNVWGE